MQDIEQFKGLVTDIIAKQAVILGPDIAIMKARSVVGLTVADDGTVTDIKGDGKEAVRQLIDAYVNLSGMIVKNTLDPIFAKYPDIKQ